MKHLDLFSGIGGFALAARWINWETIGFVEIDPFCRKVLVKNFPGVPIHDDIRTFSGAGADCDILTGGFPCQPFSSASAGRARGEEDDRYLWPEMLRIIEEARPAWVCAENVPHLERLALKSVVFDLESLRYETAILEIPACAVGCDHRRSRLWILGYADSNRKPGRSVDAKAHRVPRSRSAAGGLGSPHGISSRMDRLRSLGNAIVPHIAYQLFRAIEAAVLDNACFVRPPDSDPATSGSGRLDGIGKTSSFDDERLITD